MRTLVSIFQVDNFYNMLLRSLVSLFLLSCLPAIAVDDPDVRKLMTGLEFKAAGLDKLSKDELDALNHWLVRYTAHDAAALIDTSAAVKESAKDGIKNRIDGQFNGWNGKTRLTLKNGQVWETRYNKRYHYSAVDPEVEISKNALGFYMLTVVETGKSIGVRRVK